MFFLWSHTRTSSAFLRSTKARVWVPTGCDSADCRKNAVVRGIFHFGYELVGPANRSLVDLLHRVGRDCHGACAISCDAYDSLPYGRMDEEHGRQNHHRNTIRFVGATTLPR